MKRNNKSLLIGLIIALLLICYVRPLVFAADTYTQATATLTINKNGKLADGSQGRLSGVTLTLYKLSNDGFTVPDFNELETVNYTNYSGYLNYVKGLANATTEYAHETTNATGQVQFTIPKANYGRFLVVETDKPAAVVSNPVVFVVDVPATNATGTGWNYNVEVDTKSDVEYDGITLKKVDQSGNPLGGVTFKLLQKNGTGNYVDFISPITGNVVTGITSSEDAKKGQITIDGLFAGDYALVETATVDGYILDTTLNKFTINADGSSSLTNDEMTVSNFNPEASLVKTIVSENTSNSVSIGDTVTWEVEFALPTEIVNRLRTYTMVDTLPDSLDYVSNSLHVYGANKTTELAASNYEFTADGHVLTLKLTNTNVLANATYSKLYVRYDTVLNSNAAIGSEGNENNVKLTYSKTTLDEGVDPDTVPDTVPDPTESTEDFDSKVYTGGFHAKLIDNSNNQTILTEGQFYIKDALGNYLTDEHGEKIVITTVNGYGDLTGLEYGTYYLEEIKSPTYTDANENQKYYNMLRQDKEITVNGVTYVTSANPTEVDTVAQEIRLNRQFSIPLLPATGGSGTIAYVLFGLVFVIIALMILVLTKKSKNNK